MNLKTNYSKINGYILLKNGKIYDSFLSLNKAADILIKDGIIYKIKNKISEKSNYKIIDCKNKIITNGFIDLHSHFREPGFESKETIETGSNAAFYGGYTRICTMPNTDPVIDTPELVTHLINSSKSLPIYIHPIGAITKGQKGKELAEIGGMVESGAVAISDDGIPLNNSYLLRAALEYSKKFNIPVINHAEDSFLVNEGLMHEGKKSLKLGLSGNPDISETTMIFRDLSIAEYVKGKIHIPHVSSYKSLKIIDQFKKSGLNVTAEVTPHHLCLTDEILNEFNLVDHIDVCVTSKDALAEKPDPKIFSDALTLLNVKPDQSVYVGDQILSDIQGSNNVGIIPLLIDRDNINIDYSETNKINSLYELNNFLSTKNN